MADVRGKDIYKSSETAEQEAVIEYCDLMSIPIVHIPNEGKRSVAYAAQLKRLGLRSGFPDLFLPLARGGYFGLFIEMKYDKGKLSKDQKKWLLRLKKAGYRAVVCRGADAAIEEIKNYLKCDATDNIEALRSRVAELEVLLFAFVWNRTTYPLGRSLGKSEREIAEKTFETVAAASDMVDMARMREIMEKYRKDTKNEGSDETKG